jgi:hypothetical protein
MLLEPRDQLPALDGCAVVAISREQARPIILRYKWLGTMGGARAWYGLRAPDGELLGAAGLGHGVGRSRGTSAGPRLGI